MSNTLPKKQRLFDAYSANLKNYLDTIDYKFMVIVKDQKDPIQVDPSGNVYLCPLCFQYFFKQQLEQTDLPNYLTLEHNPPKSMGGTANILTCKACNNNNGAENDKLVRDLLVTESFLSSDESTISAKFLIDGQSIKGRLKKIGTSKGIIPSQKSNPRAYEYAIVNLKAGKKIKIDHELTAPEWSKYSLGMLKIAYLKAFELFGYHFADLDHGAKIRDVLYRKAEYSAPNNGIMDFFAPDDFIGINIVTRPAELRAMIITLPIRFEHDENIIRKNVPVILPAPIKNGWELLRNYTRPHGAQLNFRSAKYSIKTAPIIDSRAYHNMFFESFRDDQVDDSELAD